MSSPSIVNRRNRKGFNDHIDRLLDHMRREQSENSCPDANLSLNSFVTLEPATRVIILCSGGLDSAVLLALAQVRRLKTHAIYFTHNTDHEPDAPYARRMAERYAETNSVVQYPKRQADPSDDRQALAERYSVYLSVAAAEASVVNANHILFGLIYEDWTKGDASGASPKIIRAMNNVIMLESDSNSPMTLSAPLAYSSKTSVAALSLVLGISENDTVSCDTPLGSKACGVCAQCAERNTAFADAVELLSELRLMT